MKQILKIFNRFKKSAPTEAAPEYNFFRQGPKADTSPYCTRLLRDRDYNPESYGGIRIVLCPNTTLFRSISTSFKTLSHDSITDFFKALKNGSFTVIVYTANAENVPVPNAVHLVKKVDWEGKTEKFEINSSFWCKPSDVDEETVQLVQKILDCWDIKINFNAAVKDWKERYERLEKDGNSHTVAEMSLFP